jgi:hypothetical protein
MVKPKRRKLTPREREQLNFDSGYYKGGSCDSTDCYQELVEEILDKSPDLKRSDIYMLDHDVVGEVCVHIKGKWVGYVNGFFYEGDIDNWVWYCNQQKNKT